jgi:CheY-like chemotaxis protein
MEDTESAHTILAVVDDLMFGSRIRGAAQHAGVNVVFVRATADLLARAAGAELVLLDLETRWLDAPAAITALKAAAATAAVPVVAFGPHVAADALTAARLAGADRVLARSAFVKLLPELLRG